MNKKMFRLIAKCIVCMLIAVEFIGPVTDLPLTDFPDPITIESVHTETTF